MTRSRVHVAPSVEARARASGDPFETYPPPFNLDSDLLLVAGTCALAPLRSTFPHVPFLEVGSRAVLGVWFARVHDIRSGPNGGRRIRPATPSDLPYQELNVGVLLRGRRLFVPGIYATSELTLALGHRYGMPKKQARMTYQFSGGEVSSQVRSDGGDSRVVARSVTGGRLAGTLVSRALPWWSWPVHFPSGSRIEALLERAEDTRLVWLSDRRLALNEPWLPEPVSLWRLGLHVPRQRMRLPAPPDGRRRPSTVRREP